MANSRRNFLVNTTTLLTLVNLGFLPANPLIAGKIKTWQQSWFDEGQSIDETFAALGIKSPVLDNRVIIHAPDTAENGAYVGVSVESSIRNINGLAFFVEKNPHSLAGYFEIKRTNTLKFATKIKMAETSDLVAMVKANDSYYINSRYIKVVLGGCGS